MVTITLDLMTIFNGLVLCGMFLYSTLKMYLNRRNVMAVEHAYIKDITKLLFKMLRSDWKDLPLTVRLDRYKAIVDLMFHYGDADVPIEYPEDIETLDAVIKSFDSL